MLLGSTYKLLNETCGYELDAPNLWLDDYSGSRSHRNGLIIATGRYDWIDSRLLDSEYRYLGDIGESVRMEVGCSNFQLETMLCSYKKLARARDSRYVGYYLDRQAQEIRKTASDGWNGIDWSPWWDARYEQRDRRTIPRNRKPTNIIFMSLHMDV